MPKVNIEKIRNIVSKWAYSIPFKCRIYLFGSQYKGTANTCSDVDIAFELLEVSDKSKRTLFWIDHHEDWEELLTDELKACVHLCLYEGKHSPSLHKSFQEEGYIILFERLSNNNTTTL